MIDNSRFEMVNSKYAMTSICNILMNLTVLEPQFVEDSPIFFQLLKFIMNSLPTLVNDGKYAIGLNQFQDSFIFLNVYDAIKKYYPSNKRMMHGVDSVKIPLTVSIDNFGTKGLHEIKLLTFLQVTSWFCTAILQSLDS